MHDEIGTEGQKEGTCEGGLFVFVHQIQERGAEDHHHHAGEEPRKPQERQVQGASAHSPDQNDYKISIQRALPAAEVLGIDGHFVEIPVYPVIRQTPCVASQPRFIDVHDVGDFRDTPGP